MAYFPRVLDIYLSYCLVPISFSGLKIPFFSELLLSLLACVQTQSSLCGQVTEAGPTTLPGIFQIRAEGRKLSPAVSQGKVGKMWTRENHCPQTERKGLPDLGSRLHHPLLSQARLQSLLEAQQVARTVTWMLLRCSRFGLPLSQQTASRTDVISTQMSEWV